jgi:AhpD family alkylhydroperoxidase
MTVEPPRIPPGGRREIGAINYGLARLIGLATGGGPPNIFTTLARHRRLFRRWLWFAGGLMPGGKLRRADSELVILRVAENCACDYERVQHERIARTAGLSAEEVARARLGPDAGGWSPRQRLLLLATDELHATRTISGGLWGDLRAEFGEVELIELCLLVGHYEMLAMTLNALAVAPDKLPDTPPAGLRVAQKVLARR